jgi:hypothetical protein
MPSPLSTAQKRLTAAEAKRRRAALGPPLTLSAADLDILSNVGPTDQAEAQAFARAVAGGRAVDLMEAR